MAKRMSLTVRVSAIVSLFVAFMLAAIIAIISLRLAAEVNALSLADNQQITVARSLQLGELMDKLYWQLKMISVRNQFMTGDKKTIESAVLALNGKLSPEVVGAFYVWPNGDYLTTEGARANVADRDYFTAIMEQGADAYVGEAVISKALGAPIVVSAMAVKGVDGKTRGFAALQFKLEKLSEITNGIKVGKTGYGWIMDNTGLMIAHANAKAIMTLNATNADKDGARGMDALAKRVLSEEAGHGTYYNANGQQMTIFYVRVPNTPRWTLGVSVPTAEINATATALTNLLLLILLVAIVLSVLVSILIARSIVKPIKLVVKAMDDMSKGDLALIHVDIAERDKVVARRDELGTLGKSIRELLGSLREIVSGIKASSNEVSSGSQQLSNTAQGLSQGANEQAASIEELSASVEELASTIRQNADNTKQADALSRKIALNAEASGKSVEQTVASMKEIASKIGIIEEIASQTNMLALNAAIEAARAGEAGKGFAVVASEVRKLAERSAKAAGEINELSKKSVTVAGEAGRRLDELVPDIKKTAELIQEISAASGEQSSGAEQLAKGVSQMDTVMQQNASSSEELAATAEELAGQAMKLSDVIGFFEMGDDASRGSSDRAVRKETQAPRIHSSASSVKPASSAGAVRAKAKSSTAIAPVSKDASDSDFEEF